MPMGNRRRLPTLLLAAGTVFLALGAAHLGGHVHGYRLGRLGTHRTVNDALVFEFQGRLYAIRYNQYATPQKLGTVSFKGDITAVPIEDWAKHEGLPAALAGGDPPRQTPDRGTKAKARQ
jgi:hypothetical protein